MTNWFLDNSMTELFKEELMAVAWNPHGRIFAYENTGVKFNIPCIYIVN